MTNKKSVSGGDILYIVAVTLCILGVIVPITSSIISTNNSHRDNINQTKPILFNAADYEIKINNNLINLNDYSSLPEEQQVIINKKIRAIELTNQ